ADLAEIRRFNQENGGVVSVATGAEPFAAAITAALNGHATARRPERIEAARRNSWALRISRMWGLVEAALEARDSGDPWDVRLRRMYRTARRRTVEAAVAVVAVFVLLFYTPVPWWLASPLTMSEAPRPADAIVVFAG